MNARIEPGTVVWVSFDPTIGREPGTRPAVVVAPSGYLRAVRDLAIVVPGTTTDRGWPHHVQLRGRSVSLPRPTFAMTEQPRTISRRRIVGTAGRVDGTCLRAIRRWLDDFLSDPHEGSENE